MQNGQRTAQRVGVGPSVFGSSHGRRLVGLWARGLGGPVRGEGRLGGQDSLGEGEQQGGERAANEGAVDGEPAGEGEEEGEGGRRRGRLPATSVARGRP